MMAKKKALHDVEELSIYGLKTTYFTNLAMDCAPVGYVTSMVYMPDDNFDAGVISRFWLPERFTFLVSTTCPIWFLILI